MTVELHVVLGTGPAGSALAEELLRRGRTVRTVSRRGTAPVEGVEGVAADVRDAEAAADAVAGASVVYHCVNVPYEQQIAVLPDVQQAVLAAVEAAGARLVVTDTLYPYGPTGGAVMTEDTPWNAVSGKGRMRAELDRRYLDTHAEGRVRVVLGRAADFFGQRVFNSTLGAAVFPAALTGETALALGDIDLPHSYTYIRDVATGLALLGERPDADGRVWHLPTAPAVPTRRMHELIAEAAGRPLSVDVLDGPRPWGPFDEVVMGEYAELFYQYLEPQIVDSSAFEEAFGVRPTPLDQAIAETVAWFRAALRLTAG